MVYFISWHPSLGYGDVHSDVKKWLMHFRDRSLLLGFKSCWKTNRLFSSNYLAENYQISCSKMCVPIFTAFSLQSPVRHDNYSNWVIFCYLTRPQIEEIYRTSFLCRMIAPKMQNVLMLTFLILKERAILIHESNICRAGKTTY